MTHASGRRPPPARSMLWGRSALNDGPSSERVHGGAPDRHQQSCLVSTRGKFFASLSECGSGPAWPGAAQIAPLPRAARPWGRRTGATKVGRNGQNARTTTIAGGGWHSPATPGGTHQRGTPGSVVPPPRLFTRRSARVHRGGPQKLRDGPWLSLEAAARDKRAD